MKNKGWGKEAQGWRASGKNERWVQRIRETLSRSRSPLFPSAKGRTKNMRG